MQAEIREKAGLSRLPLEGAWVGFLLALIAAGGWGLILRWQEGLAVTNLTSTTPWGAWVAFYIYFVGLSAGAFLLSTLTSVFGLERLEKVAREALWVAIVSMNVALLFVLLDLGRMERFWHAIVYWNWSSVLAWEVHFYLLYIALLAAELYLSMRGDLVRLARAADRGEADGLRARAARLLAFGRKEYDEAAAARDKALLKVLGAFGIPVAIFGVHGGTGALFAVLKARPYWNSGLFPIIFVVSALVSGAALVLLLHVIRERLAGRRLDLGLVQLLARLMVAFLLIDLGLQFYELLVGFYSLEHEELATLWLIMRSPYAWSYWGVQIGLGAAVPIFLVFWKRTARSVTALAAAAAMVVVGIVGVRFNIVVPALLVPVLDGLPWGYYYPTLVEWATSAGMIAIGLLLYSFGVKALPLTVEEAGLEGRIDNVEAAE